MGLTLEPFQRRISFPIFQSTIECPQYTDVEGCTELGTLTVDVQDSSEELRHFRVNHIVFPFITTHRPGSWMPGSKSLWTSTP
jgi:hypothetical protein